MNEGIVERGEDTSNTENLGTVCMLVIDLRKKLLNRSKLECIYLGFGRDG